jgi:hypothetical protein
MPIPFPKMHIAQSVLNRVMNAMDEQEQAIGLSAPEMATPPTVIDPAVEGDAIEVATSTPPAPVELPPGMEAVANEGMQAESAMGGSPFDGALLSL